MGNLNDTEIIFTPIQPNIIIDEVSSTEYYVGTSINSKSQSALIWSIKKISKTNTIWNVEYPDGDQGYGFAWSERLNYSYE